MSVSLLHRDFVVYPESDGEPLGETELHVLAAVDLIAAIRLILRARKDAHVGGNLFVYWQEGDPKQVVCPDVFVAFGTHREPRRTWKMWEEGGKFPDLVIEIVSPSSRRTDAGGKRGQYETMGVGEYFLFDPERLGPGPALWGFERRGDRFVPMHATRLPGGEVRLRSRLLGHHFESEGARVRLRNARTGRPVLRLDEQVDETVRASEQARRASEQARRASEQARREAVARRRAEREVVRLRAALARRRGKQGQR